eukprot:s2326_g13.t1
MAAAPRPFRKHQRFDQMDMRWISDGYIVYVIVNIVIPSKFQDPKTIIQNCWKYRDAVVFHGFSVSKNLLEMLFGDNKPRWPWMRNGGDPFTSQP